MSNEIKRWLKIIVSVVVILVVMNIMQCAKAVDIQDYKAQPSRDWEQCKERIETVGACCMEMRGAIQVMVKDGEEGAVRAVQYPEHFKHKICEAVNETKGA